MNYAIKQTIDKTLAEAFEMGSMPHILELEAHSFVLRDDLNEFNLPRHPGRYTDYEPRLFPKSNAFMDAFADICTRSIFLELKAQQNIAVIKIKDITKKNHIEVVSTLSLKTDLTSKALDEE